jgi:hypothetical protein
LAAGAFKFNAEGLYQMTIALYRDEREPRRGLRILPQGSMLPLGTAVAAGLVFGAYMALADALLFRDIIPVSQTALVSGFSALERIVGFAPLVLMDELEFRLVLVSALVWILGVIAGKRVWCVPVAIGLSALVAYPALHHAYLASLSFTPLVISREILLHGAAGVLWGTLYWRYGLLAAIAGHMSAHVSLEPLLSLLFT